MTRNIIIIYQTCMDNSDYRWLELYADTNQIITGTNSDLNTLSLIWISPKILIALFQTVLTHRCLKYCSNLPMVYSQL